MAPRRLHPNPVKTRLTTFLPFVLDELMGTAFSVALPFGLDELMETAFSVVPTAHVGWLKPATPPSASSSLNFGVESFQFHAGIFNAELPVDPALFGIRLVRPGCNFSL